MGTKPDWKDAPKWAGALVVQNGFNGPCYCWVSVFEDDAKAQWQEDLGRDHMAFALRIDCWKFVESRPC